MRLALTIFLVSGCGLVLKLQPQSSVESRDSSVQLDTSVADSAVDTALADAGREDVQVADARIDAARPCEGASDGLSCGTGRICLRGQCQTSRCGDDFVDPNRDEECDEVSFTCDECRWVCNCPEPTDSPCFDRVECNGGACDWIYRQDGPCVTLDGHQGQCVDMQCVQLGCGNGRREQGEECDDGNTVRNDGCEPDCTLTCESDEDCDDGDRCNGVEQCGVFGTAMARRCGPGAPIAIPECHICDPVNGVYLPDQDGDGWPADLMQDCEMFDCNDDNPLVFPGATEACNNTDDNCDGNVDDGIERIVCAVDHDRDGFPSVEVGMTIDGCAECPDGTAPVRRSVSGDLLLDCWDDPSNGRDVRPDQIASFGEAYCSAVEPNCPLPFDYNCDDDEERLNSQAAPDCQNLGPTACFGDGWTGDVPACGDYGDWSTCRLAGGDRCVAVASMQLQTCR